MTVLDLTAFWAGPASTHHLATLGADVLKVESPTRPDGMRFATVRPPTDPDWMEYGPTFHGTNPGKRSVTIDFSTPEGRELVLRLVERADVVVENFTPRVLGNVGLEYARPLHAQPRRHPAAHARVRARRSVARPRPGSRRPPSRSSGIAWMTGEAGGEALVRSTIDPIAGIHGAFVVLAALEHRERTGEGQMIEMPMAEVALNVAAEPIVTWSAYGTLLERAGNRGAAAHRRVSTRARDTSSGWHCRSPVTASGARSCGSSASRSGRPTARSRPARGVGRARRHRRRVGREWFAGRDRDDTVDTLLAAGVPAAPVWDQMIQDELPQLAERGFTQWIEHPLAGLVGYPGTGLRADRFDNAYRAPRRPSASTRPRCCATSSVSPTTSSRRSRRRHTVTPPQPAST